MTTEQLENWFITQGYNKVSSNLPEFSFYYHKENYGVNVVYVLDYRDGLYITLDQYYALKDKIYYFFENLGEKEVHILTLVLSDDFQKARQLTEKDSFSWMILKQEEKLVAFENQASDFYGIRNELEKFLKSPERWSISEKQRQDVLVNKQEKKGLPWVTIILVIMNVCVYLLCTMSGDVLYNKGAFSILDILARGEAYRILTAMFLHIDIQHLFSNMIVLFYVGEIVEERIGHFSYLTLYFISGIAGFVLSMAYELWSGDFVYSVGASGAVFGIEGALLMLVILHRGRMASMTVGRVVFAVAFSLYCGFTSSNINNAAHVGGLLMGFLTMAIMWMCSIRIRRRG